MGLSSLIGYLIGNKYNLRVKELEDIISALELLETRVKYTYDTIADSFYFVANNMKTKAYRIFIITSATLNDNKNLSAGDIFRNTVDEEGIRLPVPPLFRFGESCKFDCSQKWLYHMRQSLFKNAAKPLFY